MAGLKRAMLWWLLTAPTLLAFGACSDDNTSGPGDGGVGSDTGDGGLKPCDPQLDASCINDTVGIFVKSGATGTGTRAAPFGKIADAVKAVGGDRVRIFVCEGTYVEAVVVDRALGLYGGLTGCDGTNWKAEPGKVSTIKAPPGIALDISRASVELTDLVVEAGGFSGITEAVDGVAGKSSIAAWVHANATVTAKRSRFIAGPGGNAKPTLDDAGNATPAAVGGAGGTGDTVAGGAAGVSTCAAAGGKGGKGGSSITADQSTSGMPVIASGKRGCNGMVENGAGACAGGASCGNGESGLGGTATSATGATSIGALSATGFTPTPGVAGTAGKPGNGGGGGGGAAGSENSGGGGGAGGCGGAGGKGGGAGGASIAILVHDASFSADDVTQATPATAGNGGKGQRAQNGGDGGGAGSGNSLCSGGYGGGGAGGQSGQGGAAGLAAGIVFGGTAKVNWRGAPVDGAQPPTTLPGVELQNAKMGSPGPANDAAPGGTSMAGAAVNDGAVGVAGLAGASLPAPVAALKL